MSDQYLFTSESVSEGHPDKIADQVSDAILDALLAIDPHARVACETLVKNGMVVLAGEVATQGWVDFEKIARETIREIGYDDAKLGFHADTCAVISAVGTQSADIALGVDEVEGKALGAGDQGIMFGYASNETDQLMPAPIQYAHALVKAQAQKRKDGTLPWLRPDAKSQVTFRYDRQNRPVGIDCVVLSTQHDSDVNLNTLREGVMEEIIKPVLPQEWVSASTRYLINPTGRFIVGGPVGDCGLTGRKIIVDTYGGMSRHGGGCFSGKDPSKVDRSAAYAARYVAKNIVAAGLAERCEVQLSYAIGVSEPVSLHVETFGTGVVSADCIEKLIEKHFDLSVSGLITMLDLYQPIYKPTAAYGHFGRPESTFTWEKTDKAALLKEDVESLCACC